MVKKLHFVLLFASIFVAFTQVFASKASTPLEIISKEACFCDAPAPDSFRITSTNANSISLAWSPAPDAADHTLEVLKKEGNGVWVPLDTFFNVVGSSYTVTNLLHGSEYRFIIAANCASGEPSHNKTIIDGIVLILELVMAGRTPLSPVLVEECSTINYLEHNWVGFKIALIEGEPVETNYEYFEFGTRETDEGQRALVKRVSSDPDIVACEPSFNTFPAMPAPQVVQIYGTSVFKITKVKGNSFQDIGMLNLIFNEFNHTVQICKNIGSAWYNRYSFEVMTAELTHGFSDPKSDWRSSNSLESNKKAKVQNPVTDMLNIFLSQSYTEEGEVTIRLLNTDGQTVLIRTFEAVSDYITLSVETLPIGVYVLNVKTDSNIQTIKVIKSE